MTRRYVLFQSFFAKYKKIKISPLRLNCPNLGMQCNECQGKSIDYCDDCSSRCLCGNKIESPINLYVMHCVICALSLCNDSKCVIIPWDLTRGRHNEEYTHLDCCNKSVFDAKGITILIRLLNVIIVCSFTVKIVDVCRVKNVNRGIIWNRSISQKNSIILILF